MLLGRVLLLRRCSRRIGVKPVDESIELFRQASASACRAATTCTPATASRAAFSHLQVAGQPLAELRERRARTRDCCTASATRPNRRLPAAAPAAHRLAARRAAITATRSATASSTRQHARRDPGARQSLVRGRLVHRSSTIHRYHAGTSARRTRSREIAAELSRSARASSRAPSTRCFYALAMTAAVPAADAGAARELRRGARDDPRADARAGWTLCPVNYRAHAAARRGRVRAAARRAHRGAGPLRSRDRRRARATSFVQHRGARRRARGALLARGRASRTSRGIYLEQGARRPTGPGARRQSSPISRASTARRGAQRDGVA